MTIACLIKISTISILRLLLLLQMSNCYIVYIFYVFYATLNQNTFFESFLGKNVKMMLTRLLLASINPLVSPAVFCRNDHCISDTEAGKSNESSHQPHVHHSALVLHRFHDGLVLATKLLFIALNLTALLMFLFSLLTHLFITLS